MFLSSIFRSYREAQGASALILLILKSRVVVVLKPSASSLQLFPPDSADLCNQQVVELARRLLQMPRVAMQIVRLIKHPSPWPI